MEPLLLIVFIYFFAILALGRAALRRWRTYRRERSLWKWSSSVLGNSVENLVADFGPPFDVFRGDTRTLYEWKFPPATGFPPGPGLLIIYVTVDNAGAVTHAVWQTRGAEA